MFPLGCAEGLGFGVGVGKGEGVGVGIGVGVGLGIMVGIGVVSTIGEGDGVTFPWFFIGNLPLKTTTTESTVIARADSIGTRSIKGSISNNFFPVHPQFVIVARAFPLLACVNAA